MARRLRFQGYGSFGAPVQWSCTRVYPFFPMDAECLIPVQKIEYMRTPWKGPAKLVQSASSLRGLRRATFSSLRWRRLGDQCAFISCFQTILGVCLLGPFTRCDGPRSGPAEERDSFHPPAAFSHVGLPRRICLDVDLSC